MPGKGGAPTSGARSTSGRFTPGVLQQKPYLSAGDPGVAQKTSALLDSGAEESFLDAETAARWGVPLVEVSKPLVANSLNGQHIGRITRTTIPLTMRISGNPQEVLIIDTPHSPVVLGHPWMAKHRPRVDWAGHKILAWDTSCATRCFRKAHSPMAAPRPAEGSGGVL